VVGGPDENLAGGQKKGELPGCEVTFTRVPPDVTIDELPSRANGFRVVKLHNSSKGPISLVELKWEIK
jgi:hypothetical protein